MNTQLIPIAPSTTMSSREIAELTGKLHNNVLRDIDNLLETLNSELSSGFKSSTYISGTPPREYRLFLMDRDSSYCLMAGYDANARMRIIKRWQELETQPAQNALPNTILAAQIAELFQGKVLVDAEILHTLRHRLDGVESIFQQLGAQLDQKPPKNTPNNVVQLFNKPSQAKLNRQNWEKPVRAFLANRTETTVTEVLNHIGVEPTHGHKKHMAQLLKKHGLASQCHPPCQPYHPRIPLRLV